MSWSLQIVASSGGQPCQSIRASSTRQSLQLQHPDRTLGLLLRLNQAPAIPLLPAVYNCAFHEPPLETSQLSLSLCHMH